MKRIGTMVVALVLASGVLGAWFSAIGSGAERTTSHPVLVPLGWKTYTYGNARISVPNDWAVVRNNNCPVRSAPGTLELGSAMGLLPPCPGGVRDANVVTLGSLPRGGLHTSSQCARIRVNGLAMLVGPCGSSNAGGIVIYWVPALGVQAVGMGTNSENVTGPGTGTVVGRVLHTLRR